MTVRKKPAFLSPDAPLMHADHRRPVSRRDLIRQGFMAGAGAALIPSALSLFSRTANAAIADDVRNMAPGCTLGTESLRKVPFICFDLAGGANIAGSNVLVGTRGQFDSLTTAGYSKLGLPADMIPVGDNTNVDSSLGLAFHSDSAMLRGIRQSFTTNTANTNGFVIPARSDNDTGNNPHNPMYGIARYAMSQNGVFDENQMQPWGQLMALIGSRSSVSGGNSMTPSDLIVSSLQPTKIDRPSDARGLINTGSLMSLFNNDTAVAAQVLESMARMSREKLDLNRLTFFTNDPVADANLKDMISCGYVKASDIAASFSSTDVLDPALDPDIVGESGIFTSAEFNSDSEFRKTASVMKLVLEGRAGAGTITMGGFDYHTSDRATGEIRDQRAGRCMGACLEYAARLGVPLMMYVFSDGSVASNGVLDNSVNGGGKGVWTGDNSSTAASFALIYNPTGQPALTSETRQIGIMRSDASVDTGSSRAANNVNLLVDTVVMNYMALHGDQGLYQNLFGNTLGADTTTIDASRILEPLSYNFAT
ncbi:MAG: general secretion pathway protein GspF [Gammaproteobacteria bacterium]|nr:MAG: general secretion pathway protein GspF [Gammaproteobacteria bacterium]